MTRRFRQYLCANGTIAQGGVVVPVVSWKVVLILSNGSNDLKRVNKATRTIAVIVPNLPPLQNNLPWRQFRTHVNDVEYLTGYDFLSEVLKNTQEIIVRRRETQ